MIRKLQSCLRQGSKGAPIVFLAALLWAPRPARADVASCTALHASGQREAKAGRLKHASEQFLTCASSPDRCPDAVRAECTDLYGNVQKVIPTVVFTVSDEQGRDLTNVKVYSTDQLIVESLTGRPIPLDPGKHHFRFVFPSGDVLATDILVREGEKNRVVGVRTREARGASRAPARPATARGAAPAAPAATGRSLSAGFWVASTVGVASLASFGVFALLGHNSQSALETCSPTCDLGRRDDYDKMRRDYLIADISLGAAAVSLGVATWLFFSAGSSGGETPKRGDGGGTSRFAVVPLPDRSGAAFFFRATGF
jgi:hypothetical protein